MNLYRSPQNVFVASFIGNPSMNFIKAVIVPEGKDLYVEGAGFKVKVPEGKAQQLDQYHGKEVIFGIRPENINDEVIMLEAWPQSQ